MPNRDIKDLQQLQALPLSLKIKLTQQRIRQWVNEYGEEGVYVSFSGGKDSTVLLHLVRELYPDVPAVFCDVPTQYPELKEFATSFDNVTVVRPKIGFAQVCEKYGFPLISKEVSETVAGARKYLTRIFEAEQLGDRQTDRQTDSGGKYYRERFERVCGLGLYSAASMTKDERDAAILETVKQCKGGELYGKAIDNAKVQMLLGIYQKGGKLKPGDTANNRSRFSCAKYQFFLTAPFEISNQCCYVMKKAPMHKYQKETGRNPITAQMASESKLRKQSWLKNGCNAFKEKNAISNPMSFWLEQDVLLYIYQNKIPICSVYGDVVKDTEVEGQLDFEDLGIFDLGRPVLKTTGCNRTGCMLCGFGCHLEKGESRFERLHKTHPKMYAMLDVMKNNGVTMRQAIEWTNEHGNLDIRL